VDDVRVVTEMDSELGLLNGTVIIDFDADPFAAGLTARKRRGRVDPFSSLANDPMDTAFNAAGHPLERPQSPAL
jgi:hypothetical protein